MDLQRGLSFSEYGELLVYVCLFTFESDLMRRHDLSIMWNALIEDYLEEWATRRLPAGDAYHRQEAHHPLVREPVLDGVMSMRSLELLRPVQGALGEAWRVFRLQSRRTAALAGLTQQLDDKVDGLELTEWLAYLNAMHVFPTFASSRVASLCYRDCHADGIQHLEGAAKTEDGLSEAEFVEALLRLAAAIFDAPPFFMVHEAPQSKLGRLLAVMDLHAGSAPPIAPELAHPDDSAFTAARRQAQSRSPQRAARPASGFGLRDDTATTNNKSAQRPRSACGESAQRQHLADAASEVRIERCGPHVAKASAMLRSSNAVLGGRPGAAARAEAPRYEAAAESLH